MEDLLADGWKETGGKYNVATARTALAWISAQGEGVIRIPGTTKLPVGLISGSGQPKSFVGTPERLIEW